MQSTAVTTPTPTLFFETLQAHHRTAAIKAAVDLEVFTAIGEGAEAVPAIAKRCRASERGVRVLCDFLVIMGFLTKSGQRYQLTPDSAVFLNKHSPAYMGTATEFLAAPDVMSRFADFTGIVRRGGPEETEMIPDNPIWTLFARAMAPIAAMPAQLLGELLAVRDAGPLRVLDVAAGHGLYGIAIAKANPQAHVTALDWQPVLEVALENAQHAGVSDRFRTRAGDALAIELGGPYDLVLVPNFAHHFDEPTVTGFLRRVKRSLADDGRVAILDFIPNDDRVSPPAAASFSVTMLAVTKGGDAYIFSQYEQMLGAAGFRDIALRPLPPTMFQVVTAAS